MARHGHRVPLSPQGLHDVQLGLGVGARHDQLGRLPQQGVELFLGHGVEFGAGHYSRLSRHDADLAGDGGGG